MKQKTKEEGKSPLLNIIIQETYNEDDEEDEEEDRLNSSSEYSPAI
jgi:hypothetical protein